VRFIKFLFLRRGFPESDEMVILSFHALPHFKNDSVQSLSHPADRSVLLGTIRALVKIVWVLENLLHLIEADPSLRISS
jgi:hypothetical protein